MDFNAVVLLSVITLILATRESTAITCYTCGSLTQPDKTCTDPFQPTGVSTVQCPNSCTKVKVKSSDYDIQVVQRGCSTLKIKNICEDETRDGVKANVCACNSDNCNTATTAKVSMATTLAVVIGRILYCFI